MNAPTALVVEDEFIIAMELEERLLRIGFSCVWKAATCEDAIATARRNHPDIVLMDIQLSGNANGIDAARVISPELGVPIVFMSANTDAAYRERAAHAAPGCSYLTKPFSEMALEEILTGVLEDS